MRLEEIHEGDTLTYDCRSMAGYGWSVQVRATVLGIKRELVWIEYRSRHDGKPERRVVDPRFLYRPKPEAASR